MEHARSRPLALLAGALLLGSTAVVLAPPASAAGTLIGDKSLADTSIACDGSTDVTVQIDAETGIAGDPAVIELVLDRSFSMDGTPLADLKVAAKAFVDIIDEATDGALDGTIANGSRVGVVSFSGDFDAATPDATVDHALSTDAASLKAAIDGIVVDAETNHQAGIDLAQSELAGSSNGTMLIFTDGVTTVGGDPNVAATNAKAAGTEIFAIGLGAADVGALNAWASDPDSTHVAVTPDSSGLESIFTAIGAAIVVPAATGAQVVETVADHFAVSDVSVSKGSVAQAGNEITWDIGDLGTETVTLTYTITHDPTTSGGTESVSTTAYSDSEAQTVTFPNAQVEVHGCAASMTLAPPTSTNTVGDDHTVTATVLDDFGDPVAGITVDFGVTGGPSSVDGEASEPTPAAGSDSTDAAGEATFTWSNVQASADDVTATAELQTFVSSVLTAAAAKQWVPVEAAIDVKPGSDPSSYGAKSKGNIPVALLGSATFDTGLVDDSTVRFGDAPSAMGDASPKGPGHAEDVNGDGFMDRVYQFPFQDTGLGPSDTDACLGGEIGGLDFLGCSDVNIVG